jgi:hypothetical protein
MPTYHAQLPNVAILRTNVRPVDQLRGRTVDLRAAPKTTRKRVLLSSKQPTRLIPYTSSYTTTCGRFELHVISETSIAAFGSSLPSDRSCTAAFVLQAGTPPRPKEPRIEPEDDHKKRMRWEFTLQGVLKV